MIVTSERSRQTKRSHPTSAVAKLELAASTQTYSVLIPGEIWEGTDVIRWPMERTHADERIGCMDCEIALHGGGARDRPAALRAEAAIPGRLISLRHGRRGCRSSHPTPADEGHIGIRAPPPPRRRGTSLSPAMRLAGRSDDRCSPDVGASGYAPLGRRGLSGPCGAGCPAREPRLG
jgi:hypothetical protein